MSRIYFQFTFSFILNCQLKTNGFYQTQSAFSASWHILTPFVKPLKQKAVKTANVLQLLAEVIRQPKGRNIPQSQGEDFSIRFSRTLPMQYLEAELRRSTCVQFFFPPSYSQWQILFKFASPSLPEDENLIFLFFTLSLSCPLVPNLIYLTVVLFLNGFYCLDLF